VSARWLTFALSVVAFALTTSVAHAQPARLAPDLAAQVRALQVEKASRNPQQRKVSSQLLYEARIQRGLPAVAGVPSLRTGVEVDASGRTLLDLEAAPTARLRSRIAALGGALESEVPEAGAFRVRLSLDDVESLAALPEVMVIRPAGRATTRATNVSEGDVAHRAVEARSTYGIDGTGITIGVLSDGVDSLAALQASGDLPSVTVLPGQAGSGSEGTAMLEIVTDLAPGAGLLFATAFTSQASFAANIIALRDAGADVIVDDVAYFAEAVLQDDDVAAAVDTVVADGALYFSSAGNSGNLNDGTSGVWEGDFIDSSETVSGDAAHDFGGGEHLNEVTLDSPSVFTLHWADPLGGSGNDYDLYLTNKPGKVIVAAATDVQDGDDDPYEQISSFGVNDERRNLVITRASGSAARFLHLSANRGRLAIATAGQTGQHAGARGALGVAAVDVADAAGGGGIFAGTESVETFSSDGPRRVFYEADGTPITPGNFSSTGGEERAKPDLAAADCVSTATPGFATFCGTSAAAPHAAAIAALLLELGATRDEARDALTGTALDIEAGGPDRDSGAGIIEALAAAADAAPAACENGLDDDSDGLTDDADPGCDDASDDSERSGALPCDDGADNDSDGFADFSPTPGVGDPGCQNPGSPREDPQCQDGLNNDAAQDSLIDFDGGASAGLPLEQQTEPDPQCIDMPFRNMERVPTSSGCGIGPELFLLGVALRRLRRGAGRARD
jgi:hypothetical protein